MAGDSIILATLDVDIAQAASKLADIETQIDELKRSGANGDVAKTALANLKNDAAAAAEELEKLKKTQKDVNQGIERADYLFNKAIGGREFARSMREIGEGFDLASNKALPLSSRIQGLASSFMLGARMVTELADAMAESQRKLEETFVAQQNNLSASRQLGVAYTALRDATNGVVTAQEALATREALATQGLHLHGDEVTRTMAVMQRFAEVHGGTATEAANRFAQAVDHGDNVALAAFGVHVHTALTGAQRLRDAFSQLHDTRPIPPSAEEFLRQHSSTWDRFGRVIGETTGATQAELETIQQLHDHMVELARVTEEDNEKTARIKDTLRAAYNATRELNEQTQRLANQHLVQLMSAAENAKHAIMEMARELTQASHASQHFAFNADQGIEQMQRRLLGARQMLGNLRAEREQNASLAYVLRSEGATQAELEQLGIAQRASQGTAATDHTADAMMRLRQAVNDALPDILHGQTAMDALRATTGRLASAFEQARQRGRDLAQSMREQAFAAAQAQEAEKAASQKASTAVLDEQAGQANFSQQLAQVFAQSHMQMQTSAQTTADVVGTAYSSLTGAFKAHLAAFIQGRESLGDAAKGILEDTLLSIATESAVKAVFYGAQALAAAFTPGGQVQASGYAAAAAEYAAVAVLAGAGAAAMYGSGGGSSASVGGGSGSFSGASSYNATGSAGGGGGGVTNVYNINGILGGADTERALVRLQDSGARRGMVPNYVRRMAG